jgi:HPt (histidine-containing phosphotransfer) domain-containing protein
MPIRIVYLFLLLMSLLGVTPSVIAANAQPGCTSCKIHVDSLDHPVHLKGKWLFTRDDAPENKNVGIDTSAWKLAKTPGPWKGIYEDKKNFNIGWYRGNLEFDPKLSGQEVVFLINAYMGRVNVYVDGKEVYTRPNNINVSRYYSTQAIPVRFMVTQPHHEIAIRIDTPLMTGVYALPFELRKYNQHDLSLVAYQMMGGEIRMIVSYVALFFGFFFLLVYAKTKYSLYLVCAGTSILIFPFFASPGDYFLSMFSPETMLYLHYTGIFADFGFFIFAQYYYKFYPRANWIVGSLLALMGLTIGSMAIFPNINLFQHIRGIYFIGILVAGLFACYFLTRAVLNLKQGAGILLFGLLAFTLTGANDVFLALGVIQSLPVAFFGVVIAIFTMLWAASITFANTFVENRRLVKDLKVLNDGLEDLVTERTAQLAQKTNDIQAMMQNMPQGVLTVMSSGIIHPEYSAYLETIFETKKIAGKSVMKLVFVNTNLGSDPLSQIEATIDACIGEDRMNFEFNSHLLVTEFDKKMSDGRVKSIELSWSPICNDQDVVEKIMLCARDVTEFKRLGAEANAQKRELEIIGEILSVSQEKFQEFVDSSYQFVEENDALVRKTKGKDEKVIGVLFRNMHTIKGNARTYGLLHMTNVVHETEQSYHELRQNPETVWDSEKQAKQLAEVRTLVDEYAKISSTTLGRKGPGRRGNVERFLMVDKDQLTHTLQLVKSVDQNDIAALRSALAQVDTTLSMVGTDKIDNILAGVIESMPSLAKELGKEPPIIKIEDHDIAVRNQINSLLKNLFVHVLRNSIDHGLETAAVRQAAGKSAVGTIRLSMSVEGEKLKLSVRDDGRGLNIAKIRQVAIEKKMLTESEAALPETVAQMIFASGFSTADKVTEVSGRGVGMDAVKGFLENVGGVAQIHFLDNNSSADFRPFELVISLPGKFAVQAHD